jgi:hypothetical protein
VMFEAEVGLGRRGTCTLVHPENDPRSSVNARLRSVDALA